MDKINEARRELKLTCDTKREELFNYTVEDVKNIGHKLGISGMCNTNKYDLCKKVSDEINFIELKSKIEKLLDSCQTMLNNYQTDNYFNEIGPHQSRKLLPVLIQQVLWLLDRHKEYEGLLEKKNLNKMMQLAATIQGQCKNANSIFSTFKPNEKPTRSWFQRFLK